VHACVKGNGILTIVEPVEECGSNEVAIDWPRSSLAGYEIATESVPVTAKVLASASTVCPEGKVAIGGGAKIEQALETGGQEFWKANGPVLSSNVAVGWEASYYPSGAQVGAMLTVTAICVVAP
jgi:hypothetical protein